MYSFDSNRAAKEFVQKQVDIPVQERVEDLGKGMTLHAFSYELDESMFTNIYDLSLLA